MHQCDGTRQDDIVLTTGQHGDTAAWVRPRWMLLAETAASGEALPETYQMAGH